MVILYLVKKNIWLYHDDLRGYLEILDNNNIGYCNIRTSNNSCFFIYLLQSKFNN